jgi:hypothetical protein
MNRNKCEDALVELCVHEKVRLLGKAILGQVEILVT